MGKLPPVTLKKLGDETATLRKCIRSVIVTKARLEKLEEEFKDLEKGKLPPHRKVPGASYETVALGEDCMYSPQAPFSPGTSEWISGCANLNWQATDPEFLPTAK